MNMIELGPVIQSHPLNRDNSSISPIKSPVNVPDFARNDPQQIPKNWSERIVVRLQHWQSDLDKKIPNFALQNKLDQIGHHIQRQFAPLVKFNQWLDSNGCDQWYKQLAICLVKLPIRAVRNIIKQLYDMIEGLTYSVVHPLNASIRLARQLVILVEECTKPENWSKIGAGMLGANAGKTLITGNPLSPIGFGIGVAMLIGGVTISSLKSAIEAEQGCGLHAVKDNLWSQMKQLPEISLTGFCMGLIIGAIERFMQRTVREYKDYVVTSYEEARRYAMQFIQDHQLPLFTRVELGSSGNIIIHWDREVYRMGRYGIEITLSRTELILQPQVAPIINTYGPQAGPNLSGINFQWTYPSKPFDIPKVSSGSLDQLGSLACINNVFHSTQKQKN